MTPEFPDESLLTAYLDGELDPDQRTSIASALVSDPELAEQLRKLSSVRDLIAGLGRPALTVDLSGAIADRVVAISDRGGRRPRLSPRRRRIAAWTLGG